MKPIPKEQVWLTTALSDDDVPNALTLCFSLRKVVTARQLVLLVSPQVSRVLRETLNASFDFVFTLEEDRNTAGLEKEDFAKLFALTLQGFDKCVMLSPNMLAVKNCDELLDNAKENTQTFVWTEKGDTSILLIRPSLPVFNCLMKRITKRNGTGVDTFLKQWLQNQTPKVSFIDEKYNQNLNKSCLLKEKNVSIVNLRNKPVDSEAITLLGFIGERVAALWKEIQVESVLPLLKGLTNPTILYPEGIEETFNNNAIAIIGMGCRYPKANSLEAFWELLINAEDGTGNPPEYRWRREQISRAKPGCRKANAGFLHCHVDDFDAKFFNISPKEMVCLDPQHRLLHELVWEGLEDAAIDPLSLEGTNGGVFIGSWINDYKDILSQNMNDEFYRMYMGNSIGAGAARISHLLGLTGPSIATESGCSSAMVAVHLACKSLERRETNFALACGVNLLLHAFDGDEMPMVVSPDGHCKTFDANANGFARGEGCGVLVLKRLSDAVRDRDNIWGLIRGTGMTQEGISKSMGTPTVQCESMAMKQALEDARVDPAMVSYVEAHGTGTVVGDPMEVAAIAKAYHSDERKDPLLIGSVKTNVGHTESCSGITGIMKVVLAMQNEIIPPHRNFETLNPAIDLEAVPARIPLEPVEWKKQKGVPRMAGVSSFGITGTDAHVIIEEAPELPAKVLSTSSMERPLHIMKIAAKTDEAMDILLDSYKAHLSSTETELPDLAYTANTGRANFSQRAVVIAKSKEDAVKIIETNKLVKGEASPETLGNVCFLFTGQGSQYPGMAKQLYETSPVFRMHFEYCEKILKNNYNIDITQVLWSTDKSAEVSRTIYSQTSIFCVEYALLKLWESWGVKADYALGHSLGEFAAAVCAGILAVEDAIKLVAERSRLIDDLPRGKMLVIKAEKKQVDTLMKKFAGADTNKMLDYAAVNSPDQTVVAGDSDVILEFSDCCKKANLKCIVLEATHAFHSKHMDPMLDAYRTVAKTIKNLGGNDSKYISGMLGSVVEADNVDAEYWVQHTREKVLFLNASKKAVELGCRTFIEIGPQPVLSALTMMNNDQALTCVPSMKRTEKEWDTLLSTLAKLYVKGLEIDWEGFDQFHSRRKVSLPHYPFIGKKYWPDLQTLAGSSIHPLVGSVLPNASSTKLFQTGLNLRSLEWVKDHAIGENVIFPGAGYLEICLAAGLATVEGSTEFLAPPTRPMKVENLSIQAPLCLEESKTTQVQTVVEFNMSLEKEGDWNDMKVNIFRRLEAESTKWFPHAQATFSPLPTAEEKAVSFDTEAFFQTQTLPSNDEFTTEVYDKLASLGLKFGPNFRSLEKVWRDEKKGTILAKVKLPTAEESGHNQYIVHPVVLDAMIQAIMMVGHVSNLKKKLYIPINIGKFLWLSIPSPDSSQLFIHSYTPDQTRSTGSALLIDSTGKILAVMSSVEFIDTTVKALESVLEQQTSSMPDLWEEVWKPSLGPLQHRVDRIKTTSDYSELNIIPDNYNKLSPYLGDIFSQIEQLSYLHILISLYECGWKPTLQETFCEESLHAQLGIQKNNRQYFGFMLEVLESEGFLEKVKVSNLGTEIEWKVIKIPPSVTAARELLAAPELAVELPSKYSTTPLFNKVGESHSKIMKGEQSPLSILFPDENATWPSVAEFYTTYFQMYKMRDCIISKNSTKMKHNKTLMGGKKFVCRILEVGAGTGSFADNFLTLLDELEIEFEYTYTDISAAFFPAAEKRFEKYAKHMIFKKLNIEEDPVDQGFIPEYYDIVCASDVIHTTKDIRDTLRNVRMLIAPNGMLDIQEITRVHRFITFLFGLLDGFWRFEDFALRPRHCALSPETWTEVLSSSGFRVTGIFPMMNDHHSYMWSVKTNEPLRIVRPKNCKVWLLFCDAGEQLSKYIKNRLETTTTRKVITVHAGKIGNRAEERITIRKFVEEDYVNLFKSLKEDGTDIEGVVYCWALSLSGMEASQEEIMMPYFYLTKSLVTTSFSSLPRIVALTKGVIPLESDVTNAPLSTIWGYTRSFKNEYNDFKLKLIDIEEGVVGEGQLESVFCELFNFDNKIMFAYRDDTKYYPQFQSHRPTHNPLKVPPGTDRFQLILPETRSISDLQFGPLDTTVLKNDEVEVQIKASALNFRDVLSVIKPSEEFKDINTVGFDFAGVIKRVGDKVSKWKIGDRVSGCNIYFTALPSHVTLNEDLLLAVPEHVSFCEAATMPAVYITSVICLLDVAKITKEDVVLIHTATGGVGLSAIEICKHVGCTIIATAGSKRKQNYLRSLGIQHIFHSRNTKYGDQILELTNGRGVDVVLNSLTSEGFKEATLKACAKKARFIEMSKLNIWQPEEVKQLRPDVHYSLIDVSTADSSEWKRVLGSLRDLQAKNIGRPIPYSRFDALNVRDALFYMQKAKHIGKIVCTMPELRQEQGEITTYTPMFNDSSTYLITGGLGGIGFAVGSWMVEKGAKHVILASRSAPNSTMQARINELNSRGANVIPVQLDVGNFQQCRELIQTRIPELGLPALRGVMHAAGILNDGLIVNQNWPKLSSTFTTKVNGSMNLHELTKNLNLEHFVVFSSMATLFGSPGQANHSAANAFEDALIYHRQALGLPGTTVNWGQWGEVGVATEFDIPGIKPISTLQGITGLEYCLNSQRTATAIITIDSFLLMSKLFPHFAMYLDERVWKSVSGNASHGMKSDEFWKLYHSKADLEERLALLKDQLKIILREVLKLDDCDTINEDGNFQEMGVDSLMFVEIKNHLQALLGDKITINVSALKDCNTINLLVETLVNLIEGDSESNQSPPTMEEVNELIREDCVLPEHIAAKPGQSAASVRDIKTILLTGPTGTLGPYILRDLSNSPEIRKVICLLRPSNSETVEQRLEKALASRGLLSQVDMTKVACVSGNVTQSQLGMNPDIWEELCGTVDAVFNFSAQVQHNEQYRKRSSTKDVRAVNIGGMKNILEFACERKLKHVCLASSLLAVKSVDEEGKLSEHWPEVGDYDGVTTFAYPISKFVCDYLAKEAVERGIPVKAFRLPFISGEEETGRCAPETNHVLLRYLFILKNKMMPSVPLPLPMLPVDTSAQLCVRIFLDERAKPDLYNVGNADPSVDQEFVNVAKKLGYNVELVELTEFLKHIQEGRSEDNTLGLFKEVYSDEDALMSIFSGTKVIQKWVEGEDVARNQKVVALIPDFYESQRPSMDYVYRDLLYIKSQGWFQKFGLEE